MLSEPLVPLVVARLKEQVGFGGRVETAADLAALMRSGQAAQPQLRAHVLPAALVAKAADAAAGAFVQAVERGVSVIITLPAFDATGAGDTDRMEQLVLQTIFALAGWGTDTSVGVFQLRQGRLLSLQGGVMVYQVDFVISDQLRISS